jgi:hypothetical protein
MRAPIHPNTGFAGVMIALLLSVVCRAAGTVMYCDARAPGDNNGSDWANAYLCLQDAIKNAGVGCEIRVAQGTYTPDQHYAIRRDGNRVVASGRRTDSFLLPSGVVLKGGYAGYGAINPNLRNVDAYPSVLSGDLSRDDVVLQGHDWQSLSDFVLDESRSDNSQSVVMVTGGTSTLDGFTVTGGHAGVLAGIHGRGDPSTALSDMDGAGAFIAGGSPRFVRCTFRFNTTRAGESGAAGGAGVLCMNASPVFTECTFLENIAFAARGTSIGGAMRNIRSNPVLTDCSFVGNVASGSDGQYWGGAIANYASSPTVKDCLFEANMAVRSKGGAIFNSHASDPTLTDCLFSTNLADYGGAVCSVDGSSPAVTRCRFSNNQASYGSGGAMYTGTACASLVTACEFVSNMAAAEGGAVCGTGQPRFINCLFTANTAGNGGAMFVEAAGDVVLTNCTLAANAATQSGGALYGRESTIRAANCILWSDSPQEVYLENGTAEITYSDIQGTWEGKGNIHGDPKFLDPAGADMVQGTADDDLRLSMGSPCLDVGDNAAILESVTADLDGEARITNDRIDMGAYEFDGPFCYYVDGTAGSDLNGGWSPKEAFATIQKGIDTAREGYTVAVAPGVYTEAIDFRGKAITVAGLNGAPTLVAPDEYGVSFYSAEGLDSVLRNFVITGSDVGVFIAGSSPTIWNVTIAGNDFGVAAYAGAKPDIVNCILWNNRDGDLFGCQAEYSCIQEGLEGLGNVHQDPLFADAESGDFHLRSEKGRYVSAYGLWAFDDRTSPCIDAGDPEMDVAAERTPNGARIDMGAFGGTPEASISRWPFAGDLDQDGSVDFRDLAILAEEWLSRL